MVIHDLKRGDVFPLEGGLYETILVGDRIVLAYQLDDAMERIPDAEAADGWKSTAFSDLRFNKEHYHDDLL